MNYKLPLLLVGTGAFFWGIIGVFVTNLYEIGFTPIQVVAIRAIFSSVSLCLYILFKDRMLLKIKPSDSKYFIGTGIISFVLFNWCLFRAMEVTSISISVILLYTAPAFVAIFSRIFFKEWFTIRKLFALLATFIGCAFVIGVFPAFHGSISLLGFILGLGSGLFYALYSIFGKYALQKYNTMTVTVYTFIFAAVAVTPFSKLWSVAPLFTTLDAWFNIIGLGLFSTLLAFLLYTKGLTKIESSRASIIATIEPVVASIMSFLVFGETLHFWQYIGIITVLAAVVFVQESVKTGRKTFSIKRLS
ncbi:EamA family transporter [Bacillus sp. FJAT-49736]|uniref:DMT family transporter n=1 Tax=Bacillus sp. FJAT-49736 TaxID=2833582 RepID=UPI001BC8DDC3|nr:EamA family transporter [Bacillus sp. FJAT-49736]MBS4174381.1 EamA family transporter [Bacillus sp. FJAT-49736]